MKRVLPGVHTNQAVISSPPSIGCTFQITQEIIRVTCHFTHLFRGTYFAGSFDVPIDLRNFCFAYIYSCINTIRSLCSKRSRIESVRTEVAADEGDADDYRKYPQLENRIEYIEEAQTAHFSIPTVHNGMIS